jgi:hypothetical protein
MPHRNKNAQPAAARECRAVTLRPAMASVLGDFRASVGVDFHAYGDLDDVRRFPHHGVLPAMAPTIVLTTLTPARRLVKFAGGAGADAGPA